MACSHIFLYLLFASALAPAPISGLLVKQDSQLRSNATIRKHECINKFGMCLYPCTCVRIFHFSDVVSEQESFISGAGTYFADVRKLEDKDKKLSARDKLKTKRRKDAFFKDSMGKGTMVWSEYKLQKLIARWGEGETHEFEKLAKARFVGLAGDKQTIETATDEMKKMAKMEKMGGLLYLKTALSEQKWEAVAENYVPITTFGGDFLGPHYLSTFYTAGLHMIEAFNYLEVDMVVMGNHDLEHGMKTALRAMRCSRFAWLTANIREMYPQLPLKEAGVPDDRAPIEGGVIGNNYVRKWSDWKAVKSVLDGKDFPYQPPSGLFEIRVDSQIGALKRPSVKLCFAGLTSYSSAALKNYGNVFLPKRAYLPSDHLKTTGETGFWKPSHWPKIDPTGTKGPSVEALFESCPVHLTSGRQPESETVDKQKRAKLVEDNHKTNPAPKKADYAKYAEEAKETLVALVNDGNELNAYKLDNLWSGTEADGYFDYFNDYKFVVPSLLKEAFDADCHSFVLLTHMKAADDSHILKIAEEHHQGKLLKAVLGGHDHAPYVHFKGFEDQVPETMVVKTGMNGAFVAKMDLKFVTQATSPAYFDHTRFQFQDPNKPIGIVPVGKYIQKVDEGMKGCLNCFNRLTEAEEAIIVAKGWVGDYDTYRIKNRQTRAADFYIDILRNWGSEKMQKRDERILVGNALPKKFRHLIAFMHASAIRGAQFEKYGGEEKEVTYPTNDKQFSMLQLRTEFQKDSAPILFTMTAQDFLLAMITYVAIPNSPNFPILAGSDITLEASSSANRLAYFRRDSRTLRPNWAMPPKQKKQSITMATLWNDQPDDEWLMDAVLPSERLAIASTKDAYNQMTRTLKDVWKVVLNFASNEANADPLGFGQAMLDTYKLAHVLVDDPKNADKKVPKREFTEVVEGKGHREELLSQEAAYSIFERFHKKDVPCIDADTQDCFDLILSGYDCENPSLAHVQTLGSWSAAAKSVKRPCARVRKGDAPADKSINFMDQDAVNEDQKRMNENREATSAGGIKKQEEEIADLEVYVRKHAELKRKVQTEFNADRRAEMKKDLKEFESQRRPAKLVSLEKELEEAKTRQERDALQDEIDDVKSGATELANLKKELKEYNAQVLLKSIEASQSWIRKYASSRQDGHWRTALTHTFKNPKDVQAKEKLTAIIKDADTDNNGQIKLAEISNENVVRKLKERGIDVDVKAVQAKLDGGVEISRADMLQLCVRFREVNYETKDHKLEPIAEDVKNQLENVPWRDVVRVFDTRNWEVVAEGGAAWA